MKNRILAMPVAAPATPENPKKAASNAINKNVIDNLNMALVLVGY